MLAHFLAVALTFPSVVYTVLLGVALVYWLFVMVGAVHLDGDGAAGGAAGGALDGIDGADAGGAGHGADGAHGHGDAHSLSAEHGHAGEHGHGDGDHAGALSGILASLHLRSAPITVVFSVLMLFAWLFSVLGMQAANALLPETSLTLARFGVFVLAPLVALPFTSVAIRPLARVFLPPVSTEKRDLVGKICTVRTGTVTDRFGEGLLEDGGAGLVVRIRIETGDVVRRGDQVVILGYDSDRHEFTVAPMDNLLDARDEERGASDGDAQNRNNRAP